MATGAIYARVSTDEADELQDPSRQLHDCRDRLNDAGVENIDVYSERGSGADDTREGLQELLAAVKDGQYDCICMSEISRLARRTAVAAEFIDVCIEDQQIPIYIVDDMIDAIDPDNPMSSFFAKQLALWYEEERRQTIRRIKSGIKQAQRDGRWTARPPKGFTTDDDGYLVPDIDEFLQVQAAIERVLDGESIYAVAKTTPISRRTLTRIIEDDERLRLYVEADTSDERLADALADTDLDSVDLPAGFEERIRTVVREELDQ
jgi:DNA invertase Pin-like site-specific DNA recombinase